MNTFYNYINNGLNTEIKNLKESSEALPKANSALKFETELGLRINHLELLPFTFPTRVVDSVVGLFITLGSTLSTLSNSSDKKVNYNHLLSGTTMFASSYQAILGIINPWANIQLDSHKIKGKGKNFECSSADQTLKHLKELKKLQIGICSYYVRSLFDTMGQSWKDFDETKNSTFNSCIKHVFSRINYFLLPLFSVPARLMDLFISVIAVPLSLIAAALQVFLQLVGIKGDFFDRVHNIAFRSLLALPGIGEDIVYTGVKVFNPWIQTGGETNTFSGLNKDVVPPSKT